jgi:multidrug resistance efflux pump
LRYREDEHCFVGACFSVKGVLIVRLRSWRGTTAVATSARRRFPWVRLLIILVVLAVAAYLLLPSYFFVSADALVQGDLVPVTPLYRARIDQLYVRCDEHVTVGQKLAVISNFLVQADYQKQYEESVAQLNLSKIALDQGVAEALSTEAAAREKYNAAVATAKRLEITFKSYDRAYAAGALPRVDWEAKKGDWQTALATAAAYHEELARAEQAVGRIQSDQHAKIAIDQQASEREESLAQRVSAETLHAPVSGYIVNCKERPENVIEPGAPMFEIFEPQRAYVLAFFNPASLDKVRIGESVDLHVNGLPAKVKGRVVGVYPDLAKLPTQLTRFFWQHEQWSEYRPVRIALDTLPSKDRDKLYYDAQSRVQIRVRNDWPRFFGVSWPAGNE